VVSVWPIRGKEVNGGEHDQQCRYHPTR